MLFLADEKEMFEPMKKYIPIKQLTKDKEEVIPLLICLIIVKLIKKYI